VTDSDRYINHNERSQRSPLKKIGVNLKDAKVAITLIHSSLQKGNMHCAVLLQLTEGPQNDLTNIE
jgi:hypothetical protein